MARGPLERIAEWDRKIRAKRKLISCLCFAVDCLENLTDYNLSKTQTNELQLARPHLKKVYSELTAPEKGKRVTNET